MALDKNSPLHLRKIRDIQRNSVYHSRDISGIRWNSPYYSHEISYREILSSGFFSNEIYDIN